MIKILGKYVIGGRSGKREQAWAVFILWAMAFVWMMHREVQGVPLPNTTAILSLSFPMVIANLAIAHGLEWASTQSKWGSGDRPTAYGPDEFE